MPIIAITRFLSFSEKEIKENNEIIMYALRKKSKFLSHFYYSSQRGGGGGGGGELEAFLDLAAFLVSTIAPVKKSVNHLRTVRSMRMLAIFHDSSETIRTKG